MNTERNSLRPAPEDTDWLQTTNTDTVSPRLWLWVTGIIAAFLVGFGVGSLGGDTVPQFMVWIVQQVVSGS